MPSDRNRADTVRTRSGALTELPGDVPGQQIDGEQVGDGAQPSILIEGTQVRERQARTQLAHACVGHLAFAHELGISLEDRLGEQLTAWDLDAELALQTENNVQHVN